MVPGALAGSLRNLCSTVTLCGVVLLGDIWQHLDIVMEQWSRISSAQVPEPKSFEAGSLHASQQLDSGQNCILALPVSHSEHTGPHSNHTGPGVDLPGESGCCQGQLNKHKAHQH